MNTRLSTVMMAGLVVGPLGTGCEKKTEVEFVRTDPVLQWQNLELSAPAELENAYVLLVKEPTIGLFPAAMAVARVKAVYRDDAPEATKLTMNTEPEAELLPWNSLLDDQRVISGVFPLKPLALQGEGPTIGLLLQTAYAMKAALCLIYGTAHLQANEAEVRGVLYDTAHRRPLVALRSHALIEDLEAALAEMPKPAPHDPEYFDPVRDRRYRDAPGMAAYTFESLVRDGVIALRKNDTPLENQPTEGWVPEKPPGALMLWPAPQTPPRKK